MLLVVSPASADEHFSRQQLVEDAREMLHLLETVHPQPYFAGGGKIAFHQRFQRVIATIPPDGLSRLEFRSLLSPFVAAVGDGHTQVYPDDPTDFSAIPLLFYVVESSLYVAAVFDEDHREMIGATLKAVEGVPLNELVKRTRRYYGADNLHGTLGQLANFELFLANKNIVSDLIPEWTDDAEICVTLAMPDASNNDTCFTTREITQPKAIRSESQMELPALNGREFVWGFPGDDINIAYLRVRGMTENRETYEKRAKYSDVSEEVADFFDSVYGNPAPASTQEAIQSLPSLTESYVDMVEQMKTNGTDTLIVDLRTNVGGWALPADFLIYFLYGKSALIELHQHTNIVIRKLSPYYFESEPEQTLRELNAAAQKERIRDYALAEYDFDFSDTAKLRDGLLDYEYSQQIVEDDLALSGTFHKEYLSGEHEGYYKPQQVFVLTDVATFSSGFMFAKYLQLMGATVVGTTPSQNTIHMGETVSFTLTHSRLVGDIARSRINLDTREQNVDALDMSLHPDYELTYEKLKEYDFARDSAVFYAIELARDH